MTLYYITTRYYENYMTRQILLNYTLYYLLISIPCKKRIFTLPQLCRSLQRHLLRKPNAKSDDNDYHAIL